jgi:hypothetical protein
VQEEVLGPGRHFVMPIVNTVEVAKCIVVPAGQVGIVTAKTGKEQAAGHILAEKGEKGVWREVLPPGVYRMNPHGYEIKTSPAVEIHAGFVGFVTNKVGAKAKGKFAEEGEQGVLRDVLDPGIYYLNPLAVRVQEVQVGIDQVSFLDNQVVSFQSKDAFDIRVEATVEWELHPDAVAEVMADFGTPDAVEKNVIEAQATPSGRNAGAQYAAKEFMLGEGREKFQQSFTDDLVRKCKEKHIDVHSAFIRHITIPQNLLKPIQEAFISVEKQKTAKVWEETKNSAADLEREQALIQQATQEVEAQTQALVAEIDARAGQEVGAIDAETRQLVAQKQQEIAALEAKRTLVLGQANATVQQKLGEARASLFALQVGAFGGDGEAFRRYTFAESLPADLRLRLVQSGTGTLWTDLAGTAGAEDLVRMRILKAQQRDAAVKDALQKDAGGN